MADLPLIVHLEHVSLALTSAAGPVPILKGVDLRLARARRWASRPIGFGQIDADDGHRRAGTRQCRPRHGGRNRSRSALTKIALAAFRRAHVGIVFQSFHLIPTMTALENVAVPLELAGRADAAAEARRMLDAVGLGARIAHYPGQLSGGEQQRVALARAFVARPRLLLADEPTGNLDRATGDAVIDLLFALNAEAGTTLLLITHDPVIAERCGRVLRMEDGRVVSGTSKSG